MGTVSISGKTFNIYGEHLSDDAGPPAVPSAKTYFSASLNATAWTGASQTTQAQALVTATRILDKQSWVGSPTDPATQPLAWPRTGVTDRNGQTVADDEVPPAIYLATYELALAILQDAAVQTAKNTGSSVKRNRNREKVGELEVETDVEYFSANVNGGTTRFPTSVQEYIKQFLAGLAVGALASGTDICSTELYSEFRRNFPGVN